MPLVSPTREGASGDELRAVLALAVARISPICAALPEVAEEPAWIGTRWRVRTRTFAHVLPIIDGAPAAFAKAVGRPGSHVVVAFRSDGPELQALAATGPPYFTAQWGRPIGGLVLGSSTDWGEVEELLTESYCLLAPRKLVAQVDRPPD
jgi:hypothetical protein